MAFRVCFGFKISRFFQSNSSKVKSTIQQLNKSTTNQSINNEQSKEKDSRPACGHGLHGRVSSVDFRSRRRGRRLRHAKQQSGPVLDRHGRRWQQWWPMERHEWRWQQWRPMERHEWRRQWRRFVEQHGGCHTCWRRTAVTRCVGYVLCRSKKQKKVKG